MYLLGYAQTAEQLRGFCQRVSRRTAPGGAGSSVSTTTSGNSGSGEWKQYGLERTCPTPPAEGDGVRYRITNADGRQFELQNFYLSPDTYRTAFREGRLRRLRAGSRSRCSRPSAATRSGTDFMKQPPIVGFAATR